MWVAKIWGIFSYPRIRKEFGIVWLFGWNLVTYYLINPYDTMHSWVVTHRHRGKFCLLVQMTWHGVMDDGCNEWDPWSLFLVACGLTLPLLEIYCMEKVWFRIWVPIGKLHVFLWNVWLVRLVGLGLSKSCSFHIKMTNIIFLLVIEAIFCPYFIFFYKIIKEKVLIQIYLKLSCSNL